MRASREMKQNMVASIHRMPLARLSRDSEMGRAKVTDRLYRPEKAMRKSHRHRAACNRRMGPAGLKRKRYIKLGSSLAEFSIKARRQRNALGKPQALALPSGAARSIGAGLPRKCAEIGLE